MRRAPDSLVLPPTEGWKPRTFYEVEVSFSPSNLIHRAIFYSGFLSNGSPAGYNAIWMPTYERPFPIHKAYYLKVIAKLPFNEDGCEI